MHILTFLTSTLFCIFTQNKEIFEVAHKVPPEDTLLCHALSMSSDEKVTATGGCICGGVRYRVIGPLRNVINCHCEPCRRFTGHHMAATAALVKDIFFEKEETLTWYQRTSTVRYGFCSQCGSSLFWSDATREDWFAVPAGCLDQPTGLITELNIYADEASDYHQLDPAIPQESGDETIW